MENIDRDLIMATTNKTKAEYYQSLLAKNWWRVLTLAEVGLREKEVEEKGKTPEENALLKVQGYWQEVKKPIMAVDYGLYIDKFSQEKQPGREVRRVDGQRLSDEEMLTYYVMELEKVGGESEGSWVTGVAAVNARGEFYSCSLESRTYFISSVSTVRNEGEPLNSIQWVRELKKYKSEMTYDEKAKLVTKQSQKLIDFICRVIEK